MSGMGKTKIVATLGPSSRDVGAIERMIMTGMNVAHINASHADRDTIREEVKALREASSRAGVEVGVTQTRLAGTPIRSYDRIRTPLHPHPLRSA
jgi:pyruvate kinase